MLQLVEMEGKLNEKGCIEIPAVMLEQTGIRTGEAVKLIYMAEEEELKNESKEFLLVRGVCQVKCVSSFLHLFP